MLDAGSGQERRWDSQRRRTLGAGGINLSSLNVISQVVGRDLAFCICSLQVETTLCARSSVYGCMREELAVIFHTCPESPITVPQQEGRCMHRQEGGSPVHKKGAQSTRHSVVLPR
jgi:hypothetical protein